MADGWSKTIPALDQITPADISRLKPAWSFDFDTSRKQEAEPLVEDG